MKNPKLELIRPHLEARLGPGLGPWRLGPEFDDPWAWAPDLAAAVATRDMVTEGRTIDPRTLRIWLVGFCTSGRWVVGPPDDRPPGASDPHGDSWGRMGLMADTLHEAVVLRHAAEGARVWQVGGIYHPGGHYLAIWETGSARRLTSARFLSVLEAEALQGSPELRAALTG